MRDPSLGLVHAETSDLDYSLSCINTSGYDTDVMIVHICDQSFGIGVVLEMVTVHQNQNEQDEEATHTTTHPPCGSSG